MKKNMVYHSMKKMFMLLLVAAVAMSCSNFSTEREGIVVKDPHNLLRKELKDSLQNPILLFPTRLEVLESLPFGSEEQVIDSLWNLEPTSVLIVASTHPDYVFVRLNEIFDGAMSAAKEGTLGSSDYYKVQLSDSSDINNKIISIINQLLNTESSMTNAYLIEYIKGEILGPIYSWTTPDDSWVYRIFYYPAQRPFVWMINLTGNYFLGLFLVMLLLELIAYFTNKQVMKRFTRNGTRQLSKGDVVILETILTLVDVVIVVLPAMLGALSIGVQVSNVGAEFSRGLVENMGLSYAFVDNFYQGSGNEPNIWLTILTCLTFYIAKYNKENGGMAAAGWCGALWFILVASSAAFAWAVMLLFMGGAIMNSKHFWADTYVEARLNGIGKVESVFWMSLTPIVVIFGAFLGNWLATRNVEIDFNRFQVPACHVQAGVIDKPRPHIETWFAQFDKELESTINE